MCAWVVAPLAGLIEPSLAPEFYVDGIGAAEVLNGCIRFYLFSEQMMVETANAAPQKVVQFKAIVPVAALPVAMAQLAQCLLPQRGEPHKGPRLIG